MSDETDEEEESGTATHADQVNRDLLAFLGGYSQSRANGFEESHSLRQTTK